MKIATIVGARPQFIKAAIVSRSLRVTPGLQEVLIHTGQHYDDNMSEVFFRELELDRANYNLGIGSGSHGVQTGRMLEAIEDVLIQEAPDWVLVYGDTNSTLAGALASTKLRIPVMHVEAGLRSFDRRMPEEVNRVVTDHVSDLLFAPTRVALVNLSREGIPDSRIHMVGDVMYDAAIYYGNKADVETRILDTLQLWSKEYLLVTLHRSENTEDAERLHIIVEGLKQVARELPIVLPVHPRTQKVLTAEDMLTDLPASIRVIAPVGYLDMQTLEKHARLIATDSGGVQKEAYFHGVPCVTLRETTEWVELVELGCNRLVPPRSVASVVSGLQNVAQFPADQADNLFGNGHSAERIAQIIFQIDMGKISCKDEHITAHSTLEDVF